MTLTVAVAGKGGTGKTTVACLIVRALRDLGITPILAIDADPSSNLHAVLGLPLHGTVGDIREETSELARSGRLDAGVAKAELLDYEVNTCVEEGEGVDLLAMGRPEGPGCYCAANTMLRAIVDRIAGSYRAVVMDTEAGLEHLSRRTTRDVDVLLVVTDPTVRGVTAARRIIDLADELDVRVGGTHLVVNRLAGELPAALRDEIAGLPVEVAATIAADPLVEEADAVGRPLVELPDDDPTVLTVRGLVDAVIAATAAGEGDASC